MPQSEHPFWILALESSTAHGGAALLRDGNIAEVIRLTEGLRHGRELLPAAAALLRNHGLDAGGLSGAAVSAGPGSYTGLRVGVMAAKALAYGTGCRLAAVSSLAALAASTALEDPACAGRTVMTVQNARRDEVYAGLYRLDAEGLPDPLAADAALAPEEAAAWFRELSAAGADPLPAGTGFETYRDIFSGVTADAASAAVISPAAVGLLGRRQFLQAETADPMTLQPVYLRRDAGAGWRHDHLIAPGS